MTPTPKTAARAVAALAVSAALACLSACTASSGASSSTSTGASNTAAAVAGGTVRVGIQGSPNDSLDMTKASTYLTYGVAHSIFDSLVIMSEGNPELALAESITPNADATEWTITIHDGVTYQDGTPVTADDVLASLNYLAAGPTYGTMYADLDLANAASDGKLTVTLPTKKPRADLVESILSQASFVFPEGTDFTKPVGSGPFKVESFNPDTGTVLVRNDDYWNGAPALERVEFIPIADATARMSAITAGQLDYAIGVTPTGVETIADGSGLAVQNSGMGDSNAFMFQLNGNKAPFNDPEVREAFTLAIDRDALVEVVFRGQGEVGNDLPGKDMVGYDDSIEQRSRDVEKAKSIFAAKSVTSISTLVAEMTPGITDAAKLMAQQLAEAGVEVTITEADPSTLWGDTSVIKANDVFSFFAINRPFITHASMMNIDGAPGNYMANTNPEFTALIAAAQAETDEAARATTLNQAQEMMHADGNDAFWGYQPVLAVHNEKLTGVAIISGVPVFHDASYQQ